MKSYEQKLNIESSIFENMRANANDILQQLVRSMAEKNSLSGTMNIKINLELNPDTIPVFENGVHTGIKTVIMPRIDHQISYSMKIDGKAKGSSIFNDMEVTLDDEGIDYVLRPIVNTEQASIFDDEYQDVTDTEPEPKYIESQNSQDEPESAEDEFEEEDDFTEETEPIMNMNPDREDEWLHEPDEDDNGEFEDMSDEFWA